MSRVSICLSLIIGVIATQELLAQPGRGGFGRGGGGGFGPGGGGMELLFRDSVKEEIELVEEQEEQLRELATSMRDQMRSVWQDVDENLSREERFQQMRERMQELREQNEEKMKDILLDHQIARLKQLELQTRVRRGGAVGALGSDELRDSLGITEEQLERMRELAQEAEQELREKIQKAQNDARDKILTVLTPDQRAKWDEMFGQPFEFDQGRGRGGFFGRGGDRGGPGGDRGGRFGRGGDRGGRGGRRPTSEN